jgi:hypothetical protein
VFVYANRGARTLMAYREHRPTKVCVVCGRPFQWRKKWKTVWDEVKYCSERCRGERNRATPTTDKQ